MKQNLPANLSSFVWHFLKPYKVSLFFFVFLSIVSGFGGPINSMLIKYIINILQHHTKENFDLATIALFLVVINFVVLDNITWRCIAYIGYKTQRKMTNQIIKDTSNNLINSSQNFFQNNLSGNLAKHIFTLAENIELILYEYTKNLLHGTSLIIICFIASYQTNPIFFYIIFVWFLVFFFFCFFTSKRIIALGENQAHHESITSGKLIDILANHFNIRFFSTKNHEISEFKPFLSNVEKAFQKKEKLSLILNIIEGSLIALMIGATIYYLRDLYEKNLVTLGDFALILGLSMELGHMIWHSMSVVDSFNLSIGRCRQSLSALMAAEEIVDLPNVQELKVPWGKITFENVSFGYKNTNSLFQEKNITIEAGQKIGLVGYSGGGKSSFVNLILRLYDLDQGRILIDDQDIRQVTQDSLRRNIGMIPQDPSLFHRSLLENIRYGRIDASDEEVINAAKKAFAHDFITALPESYQSLVGERGVKLSGGQRQRIAIARVILKNAPILILDEATSQLDSVTENDIQKSLWNLMQDKTTIIIAHRLSTLLQMQRILVFDQGKIVEDGTHDQLIELGGLYKKLWQTQSGGFIKDTETENN